VILVGLGAMGSAACAALAARGASVIGIDQFTPPHPYGSTHGDTRITRLGIGEGREYVPLVRRSHALWREIEQATGRRLLTQSGFLVLAHPSSPFLTETRAAAREFAIEHERLTSAELRVRFPMFAAGEATEAYYEPEGGYVRPEAAVDAQLELARRRGARLRFGERVIGWTASAQGVVVSTDADTYAGEQLLLCAGAWIGDLFPDGRDLFAVYRQLLYWLPIHTGYPQLRDMPAFVWDFGGAAHRYVHLDAFYGFPALDGVHGGVKVGTETYEQTTAPDGRQHPATAAQASAMYERCVAPCLPWLGSEPLRSASCLYTCTPDTRFVIDRHPEHDSVMIVSACSGHGFKHSPAIGEALAQWMTGQSPQLDLAPFTLARAGA
jgi:sarcosine oxidase